MLNYRTNDITNSTFLNTEHIKPFSRKHTIHKIQNEGMSHDAQTIKSTAKIKTNHITWNRLLLHRFLYEKKKSSQHALMKNVLASTFDWKMRFFPFSQFDTFSEWRQVITTCPCMSFFFLSTRSSNTRKKSCPKTRSERNIAPSRFLADCKSQICILRICTEKHSTPDLTPPSPPPPNNTLTKHLPLQYTILPKITNIVNISSDNHSLSLFPMKGKSVLKEYITHKFYTYSKIKLN